MVKWKYLFMNSYFSIFVVLINYMSVRLLACLCFSTKEMAAQVSKSWNSLIQTAVWKQFKKIWLRAIMNEKYFHENI